MGTVALGDRNDRTDLSRIVAGSPTTFAVRYVAGPVGLPAGAMVRFCVPRSFAAPQTENPEGDGFTTIRSTDTPASVLRVEVPSTESHEQVDILCRLDTKLDPGRGFELSYRTDRTHIFTGAFTEVDRAYWYSTLPPLAAAVALSEQHPFVSLAEGNGHTCRFVAGPSERLHLFLPGHRFASDPLSLRGLYTDRHRNSPPDGPVDAELELLLPCSAGRIPLGSPADRFTAPHRFELPLPKIEPGVYRAIAESRASGEVVAISNPLEILGDRSGADRLYWGEIHGHTRMSDGCNTYDGLHRHAREEGALDFAAAADHTCYHSDNQWRWMQDVTTSWNDPGRFVTLVGYEWAGAQVHRCLYTSRDRLEFYRGMYPPTSSIERVWNHFHGETEVIGGPHAPLAHGLLWEHHDPDVERFVEIYSMWGASDDREKRSYPLLRARTPGASWSMSSFVAERSSVSRAEETATKGG